MGNPVTVFIIIWLILIIGLFLFGSIINKGGNKNDL